jgi:hypothetical protein
VDSGQGGGASEHPGAPQQRQGGNPQLAQAPLKADWIALSACVQSPETTVSTEPEFCWLMKQKHCGAQLISVAQRGSGLSAQSMLYLISERRMPQRFSQPQPLLDVPRCWGVQRRAG